MLTGCQKDANVEVDPSEKTFPIGLWVSPPLDQITMERYAEIKESGINFISGFTEHLGGEKAIKQALDYAEANGIKMLVRDPRLDALTEETMGELASIVSAYSDHPAYMGQMVDDEPSMNEYKALAPLAEAYRKQVPGGIPFVNLFPTYASLEQKGGDYRSYLDEYFDTYKPEVLSYDHYPFLKKAEDGTAGITEDYFYNLELIRQKSLEQSVPFWLFIQTLSFNNSHRDPSGEEILWQVYTSLAYGAKGIQYFTYWTPQSGAETFGPAMIDLDGNRTKHYDEVKSVNADITRFASRLLDWTSLGVTHYPSNPPLIEATSADTQVVSGIAGDAVIIGYFKDEDGNKKAIVVNGSYEKEAVTKLTLDPSIDKLTLWDEAEPRETAVEDNRLTLNLAPGAGVLVEFWE
ncbi:beta-galactosidase [Paenibacillus mendelii]|uniref:Beta-galactosidase n=1 Tax=Paenibacillus mendelii TaxID=206163 RepID=A0ABV6J6U6_9BACL|nr:beta-galactosidase [Paenibacillus mendelii]MCQ6562017.1 beta-galactosidase [Paenibacillus mendelii]